MNVRRWLLPGLLCITACASEQSREVPQLAEPGKTLVYECNDYEFVARTSPGEITLYLPSENLVLEQVRAASGAKYSGQGAVFWSKGDTATLDLGTRILGSCHLNTARAPWEDARRRGVNFRAVGQEPGWFLEIQQGRNMLFVSGYGASRILLPTPELELEDGLSRYRATSPGHAMQVDITVEFCADSMSGEVFENAVRVTLDGEIYLGCGLALEADWD
jgi:putative lipoprotein